MNFNRLWRQHRLWFISNIVFQAAMIGLAIYTRLTELLPPDCRHQRHMEWISWQIAFLLLLLAIYLLDTSVMVLAAVLNRRPYGWPAFARGVLAWFMVGVAWLAVWGISCCLLAPGVCA